MEAVEAPAQPTSEPVTTDFVECYLRHYPRLVRALRLSGADPGTAEEVAQEAFARALTRWTRVSQGDNPPGYVYTAGFRLLKRHLERSSRWDVGEPVSPAHDETASIAMRLDVETALAAMPPRRRACAVMCFLVGLTPTEAGQALGIAAGSVRKHLDAARAEMARVSTVS